RRRLAAVFAILRNIADRRELKDAIARADCRASGNDDMRTDARAGADSDIPADDRVRADFDVRGDLRLGVDLCRGMEPRHWAREPARREWPRSARPRMRARRRRSPACGTCRPLE